MNNSYIEFRIPDYIFSSANIDAYVEARKEYAERELAIHLWGEIKKSGSPVVIDTHVESWYDPGSLSKVFRFHYQLTKVRTMDVTMAVYQPLTFTNHLGQVEWKCPWCGIINIIEATYCGEKHEHAVGCGRPREKTRQEMYA